MQGRRKDIELIGKQFYELTVISEGPRIKNKPTWNCQCSCGKQCNVTTYYLLSGRKKSCGHLRGQSRTLDLTGQVFNDLTILYRISNRMPASGKYGKTFWRCVCSCGKECNVQTSDLTMGLRKDCGHSHREYLHKQRTRDLVGNQYGLLTVIEMLPSIRTSNNKWRAMCKCKCECGNIVDVQCDYLKSGDTQSCGCLHSKGEYGILKYLNEHNIPYKKQYKFKDLKTPKDATCWFDFGILDENNNLKFLIEFQGEQHYHKMPGPWNFGAYAREVTDPLKRNYCVEHNIKLYEIKYTDDVELELDKIFAC